MNDDNDNPFIHVVFGINIGLTTIMNLHFETNHSKKEQYIELTYMFNKILNKEKFLRDQQRIMLIGDFNQGPLEILLELAKNVDNYNMKTRKNILKIF